MKISESDKNSNLYSLLQLGFGFLVVIIFALVVYILLNNIIKSSENIGVIAPYYNQSVFRKPADLPENNSIASASSSKIVKKIPIIMYHYVENVLDAGDLIRKKLNINPDIFEAELKTISESQYLSFYVKDIPEMLSGRLDPSEPPIVLTFDDGYEDFYTFAFPLLKKYQLKATIYLVNDFIGKKGYLTEIEIREIIASNLVEIGAHSLNHENLKKTPLELAKKQILDSKKKLEEKFAIVVKTFAYPYGAFDNQTLNLVKEASFSAAVSVIPGTFQSQDNLFYLSRIRSGTFSGKNIVKILEAMKK